MLEAIDDSPDDMDRGEWDRAWRAMPHRRLPSPTEADVCLNLMAGFGVPVSITVSQDPLGFSDRGYRASETCPICGRSTAGTERVPATVHPKWANGLGVGIGVWVHPTCFEDCPVADEPTPIPW